jgi:hypothetical protein
MSKKSVFGLDERYYKNLGLKKNDIEKWEDGTRTSAKKGTYEWWYFDSYLDDGSKLVIVFYTTKWTLVPNRKPIPQVTFTLQTADGQEYFETVEIPLDSFVAAKDRCDVRIGDCQFSGDLQNYNIRFKNQKVDAVVTLKRNVPSWRPGTGYIYFGNQSEYYFAWLPAVPEGDVSADVTIDGQTKRYTGTGYHDHNWGNISMLSVIHHWYWGRAKVGDYQVISSYITGGKKYGYNKFPIFMLAKNEKIIADNAEKYLTFAESNPYTDESVGKDFYKTLVYDYNDGKQHYRVTYDREKDIEHLRAIESIPKSIQWIAKMAHIDGIYIRFSGNVRIECLKDGLIAESAEGPAIWELTAHI